MKTRALLAAGAAAMMLTGFSVASASDMAEIYKNRCANCHGVKADGVPKLKEQHGMASEAAATHGVASQEKADIYGPPLNALSIEELVMKLKDLRNKDFDSASYHSVMQENLETIEEREGGVSDQKMAEYIHNTFGPGAE